MGTYEQESCASVFVDGSLPSLPLRAALRAGSIHNWKRFISIPGIRPFQWSALVHEIVNRSQKHYLNLEIPAGRRTLGSGRRRNSMAILEISGPAAGGLGKRLRQPHTLCVHFGFPAQATSPHIQQRRATIKQDIQSIRQRHGHYRRKEGGKPVAQNQLIHRHYYCRNVLMQLESLAAYSIWKKTVKDSIDVAILDSRVCNPENAISRYTVTGKSPSPTGNTHTSISPPRLTPYKTGGYHAWSLPETMCAFCNYRNGMLAVPEREDRTVSVPIAKRVSITMKCLRCSTSACREKPATWGDGQQYWMKPAYHM